MVVKQLNVHNFRNLADVTFFPNDGMNVICGENANGKTNLIEAIWMFTGAKSFRGNKDVELPTIGQEKAGLSLLFESGGVEKEATIEITNRRTATLNGKKLSGAASLAGRFYAIVFSPDDIGLVSDGPAHRRRFLDLAISQLYPPYLSFLRQYNRSLLQRNTVLKDIKKGQSSHELLDLFEEELVRTGTEILSYRKRYIEQLGPVVGQIYDGISTGKETLSLRYVCSAASQDFREALFKDRTVACLTGVTAVGPHRDDLQFCVNGTPARAFGSQGQKRSVALSMKLAEAQVLKEVTGEFPVALLDDVMSELDPGRQNYVLNHIKGWQVFITCCDPSDTAGLSEGTMFCMKDGQFVNL